MKKFWASVLKENKSMGTLFKKMGAEKKSHFGEDSDEYWLDTKKLSKAKGKTKEAAEKQTEDEPVIVAPDFGLGVFSSDKMLEHDTGSFHPESIRRYLGLLHMLKSSRFKHKKLKERDATVQEVLLVHSASYHDIAKYDIDHFAEKLRTGDTAICDASYEVAMAATGAVLNAADQVVNRKLSRVFCAIRPPGHHASKHIGMGFCIFNHVAIAARYLQSKHGYERVAILDWDVHHGNGTQDIFYRDGSVFYFSTHQDDAFPNTGLVKETGAGKGKGTTCNKPLPAGTGDVEILAAWGDPLLEKLREFKPEILIISAGFDASDPDPMSDFRMTPAGFTKLTKLVRGYADELCDGRILSVLEGGYDVDSLAECVKAHVKALA